MFKENLLINKNCLITGGGGGIGYEIVKMLLSQGATVIVVGRNIKKLKRKFNKSPHFNKKVFVYQCNITEFDNLNICIKTILAKFKKIDILINNAGINFKIPAINLLPNMLEMSIKTNLVGPFYLTILIGKHMMARKGIKRIVNISAFTGTKAYPLLSHAHVGKAGLNAMTKTLAIEWARFGILVNAIAPGQVLTRNFIHALTRMERMKNENVAWMIDDYRESELPLKKYISKKDVANMVLFLSTNLSNNITGQVIEIDGGVGINNPYLLKYATSGGVRSERGEGKGFQK